MTAEESKYDEIRRACIGKVAAGLNCSLNVTDLVVTGKILADYIRSLTYKEFRLLKKSLNNEPTLTDNRERSGEDTTGTQSAQALQEKDISSLLRYVGAYTPTPRTT
jgi:hypothetical protein